MRRNRVLVFVIALGFTVPLLRADIAAIRRNGLPQESSILAALDDAGQLEPFSESWTSDWKFPVSKDEVAARLGKDLGFLTLALRNHPDNAELALLTGLVARYAYNVDVDGSYDTATNALGHAEKLAPADFRALWFRATLQCQTTQTTPGAEAFLAIETAHAWDQLPVAFWDDYVECAAVTNMPAHLLRAASYSEKLHASDSAMRSFLVGAAQKRFDAYDPKKNYDPKEVWVRESSSADVTFTSTICGIRLRAHGDWQVQQMTLSNGSCVAYFSTGPYRAVTTSLHPSVLMLVRQPKENETLEDYSQKLTSTGTFIPDAELHCPATNCIALRGQQPGMYKTNGDGHGRIVVFERDQPEFPGLIFESPLGPPKPKSGSGPEFYHPNQIEERMPGKLYYLVLLDAAASIEEPAMKDFDFFLQNLTVE